jgi:hypothetical protein
MYTALIEFNKYLTQMYDQVYRFLHCSGFSGFDQQLLETAAYGVDLEFEGSETSNFLRLGVEINHAVGGVGNGDW